MQNKTLPHDHGTNANLVQNNFPTPKDFQNIADILHQLGDGSRLRLFWLLCHCEECVINLSALLNMSSPALSHHLRQLKAHGLVESRRQGKEVYYKAADNAKVHLLHPLIEELISITCPFPTSQENHLKKEDS